MHRSSPCGSPCNTKVPNKTRFSQLKYTAFKWLQSQLILTTWYSPSWNSVMRPMVHHWSVKCQGKGFYRKPLLLCICLDNIISMLHGTWKFIICYNRLEIWKGTYMNCHFITDMGQLFVYNNTTKISFKCVCPSSVHSDTQSLFKSSAVPTQRRLESHFVAEF